MTTRLVLGDDLLSDSNETSRSPGITRWIIADICLAMVSLCCGTPNLYPTEKDNIQAGLNISKGLSTFMLTGGVLILYITLPTGLFMDWFGADITFFISAGLTVVSYVILPYCSHIAGLFIVVFFLMAFGSSSLFVVSMQIALSRSPPSIKGFSLSLVSATMSLSFGLFLQVYQAGLKGPISCIGNQCVFSGFQLVCIVICPAIAILTPLSFILYRTYPRAGNFPGTRHWSVLKDGSLYVLLLAEGLTVYDGMLVIQCGSHVWPLYANGRWPEGASKWGTVFSVTNCICTILLSALLDFLLKIRQTTRAKLFSINWLIFLLIPVATGIIFRRTRTQYGFGILMSMMGIPFGFGLTQVPALVSDVFGNDKYGFAFGIVQIGAIIASASTMPIIGMVKETGIMIAFFVAAVGHIIVALLVLFVVKIDSQPTLAETNIQHDTPYQDIERP